MEIPKKVSRRSFVKKSAVGIGVVASTAILSSRKAQASANDQVNIAVMGIRSQGDAHIREYNALENVRVVALCDVDENLFAERIKKDFTDRNFPEPKTYVDIREMLENEDIDAVSIATPNHWHALAGIWTMQAGKHVSIEKPCCHNFFEGQKLVEAARKYKVVAQDGAEQRSNPGAQSAAEFLHGGGLGEVYMAKGTCYKWRDQIGRAPDEPAPPGVNYDLWLGPAPKRPFSKNRFHYNWHWNWDYGNGDLGNQGVHEMDVARWGLGVKLPTRVCAMGGHVMFDDDQNTPNVLSALFEFRNDQGGGEKKKMLQFDVRHWVTNPEGKLPEPGQGAQDYLTGSGNTVGNLFYGSKGMMLKNVNEWQTYMGEERTPGPTGEGRGNHYQNFVDAIRANDPALLTADIEEGFYSCALIHLANISYRLGRSLDFDTENQRFLGDDEANALLRREYREPFVVPDKV